MIHMKIEETIITQKIDLKKIIRRSIQVSADLLSETARYGQNVARILLDDGQTENRPLKHKEDASCQETETVVMETASAPGSASSEPEKTVRETAQADPNARPAADGTIQMTVNSGAGDSGHKRQQ